MVQLLDYCTLSEPCSAPPRLVVTQIRRYGDDRYVYSVVDLDGQDFAGGYEERDGEWVYVAPEIEGIDHSGLYEADQLRPVGGRHDLAYFANPGPFKHRDIVVVVADCEDTEYASLEGIVFDEHDGLLSVWFDDREEMADLPPSVLTPTGRKDPLPVPDEKPTTSLLVSGDGEELGHSDYLLVDDLRFHL